MDGIYILTSLQISWPSLPLPMGTIEFSRDNNKWKPLDRFSAEYINDTVLNIKFLNQHLAKKLKMTYTSSDTSFNFSCPDYKIFACVAPPCPPNTIHYDSSCYFFVPGLIREKNTMYHICDSIVWRGKAYLTTITSYEENAIYSSLAYR